MAWFRQNLVHPRDKGFRRTFNINIHTLELDDQNVKHSTQLYANERWPQEIYSFDSLVSLHQVRLSFPFLFEKS